MGKASYSQIGNVNPSKIVRKGLEVQDYVFFYKNEDLNNAKLEYYFDQIMHVEYVDGERKKESFSPLIHLSIIVDDKNKKSFTFDFMIEMDIDMLNKLSDKPNIINEYVIDGEIFFDNPYVDKNGPLFAYLEESMYHDNPHFWVAKIKKNKFVFKISYPEESLFIWFVVSFK